MGVMVCRPKSGVTRIALERDRQIHQKGWTLEHDRREHADGSLVDFAAALLLHRHGRVTLAERVCETTAEWLVHALDHAVVKYADRSERLLEIAGALIAAELDRLGRLAMAETAPDPTAELPAELREGRAGTAEHAWNFVDFSALYDVDDDADLQQADPPMDEVRAYVLDQLAAGRAVTFGLGEPKPYAWHLTARWPGSTVTRASEWYRSPVSVERRTRELRREGLKVVATPLYEE